MSSTQQDITDQINALITEARAKRDPAEDTELLVTLLHRAAVELNKSARERATATKGTPDWGTWAGLQNTTRGLVLQASTCRDLVRKIRSQPAEPES
ncbi:MAG: hypothetical protein ACKVVP_07825 [Chloroflexota bacterium]